MKILCFLALSLFVSNSASSASPSELPAKLQPLFEILKKIPANYKTEGTVCEQAARLQAYQSFPADRFVITTGVEYEVGDGTLGELDLVIVEKASHRVALVGEVKCWQNLDNALDKAKAQRDRFLWNLQKYPERIRFVAHEQGYEFREQDFRGLNRFIFISQVGGKNKGFDQEIPYSLLEMDEVSQALVRCQKKGECARP